MSASSLTVMACGDVGPVHESSPSLASKVAPLLASADVRIAQCERVYSTRGELQLQTASKHARVDPSLARVFADGGFDVVSMASNHALDWGPEALGESISVLRGLGIKTVGAGLTIDEAREPVIITFGDIRVAILAYCSVIPDSYAATADRAGVAPMRAHTFYTPSEWQAGMPAKVMTIPYADDLEAMVADIARIRPSVDAVIVNIHWGLHFIPKLLADYQETVARAAVRAGADVIFGGHAHLPKGIAQYDGRYCFHSLGNFVMSAPAKSKQRAVEFERRYGTPLDPDYPNLPYGRDAKRSLIASATISQSGVDRVSFRPVEIGLDLRPEPLTAQDPRFADAVDYMRWVSEDLGAEFTPVGDDIVLSATNTDKI